MHGLATKQLVQLLLWPWTWCKPHQKTLQRLTLRMVRHIAGWDRPGECPKYWITVPRSGALVAQPPIATPSHGLLQWWMIWDMECKHIALVIVVVNRCIQWGTSRAMQEPMGDGVVLSPMLCSGLPSCFLLRVPAYGSNTVLLGPTPLVLRCLGMPMLVCQFHTLPVAQAQPRGCWCTGNAWLFFFVKGRP